MGKGVGSSAWDLAKAGVRKVKGLFKGKPKVKTPKAKGGRMSRIFGGAAAGGGAMLGGLASGLGSLLGNAAGNAVENDVNSDASLVPSNSPNNPSESQVLSDSISGKLDDVKKSQAEADIRKAASDEEVAKYKKNLMDQIVLASEALNRRTGQLVGEHGLRSINNYDVDSGEYSDNRSVPQALLTRAQISRLYTKKNNDTRMSDIVRLLAANNELLGNVDLHLGLLLRQGSIQPEAELVGAQMLKKMALADKKLSESLDARSKKMNDAFKEAKRESDRQAAAIAAGLGSQESKKGKLNANKVIGLMAGLNIALPAIASLLDAGLYNLGVATGLIDESGDEEHSEKLRNFDNLSRAEQESILKESSMDKMGDVAQNAAFDAGMHYLGGNKLVKKVVSKTGEKIGTKTAQKAGTGVALKKMGPRAASIVGKRLLAKLALKGTAKTVAKKIPIFGAAIGVINGIGRAIKGDWAGAGMEVVSGCLGGSGVGILGSVAIDAGLVYRDYRIAMDALKRGDLETAKKFGLTDEDLAEIMAEPTEEELRKDDGKSPEQSLGIKDPQAEQYANRAASDAANTLNNTTSSNFDEFLKYYSNLSKEEQTKFRNENPDLFFKGENGIVYASQTKYDEAYKAGKIKYSDGQKHGLGGWIWGPSHRNGGVTTELEGGEFVVNRDSALENQGILEEINRSRQSLSSIVSKQLSDFEAKQTAAIESSQKVTKVDSEEDPVKTKIDANSTTKNLNTTLILLASVLQGLRMDLARERRERQYAKARAGRGGRFGANSINDGGESVAESGVGGTAEYGDEDSHVSALDLTGANTAIKEKTLNRAGYVVDFLMKNGFTAEQASGMAGVLIAESDIDPTAVNELEAKTMPHSSGKGIVQWSNERNTIFQNWYEDKYGERKYPYQTSLQDQLDFMLYEMNKYYPGFMREIKKAKTPSEAADIMLRGYENGGGNALASKADIDETYGPTNDYNRQISVRAANANSVYKFYKAGGITPESLFDLGIAPTEEELSITQAAVNRAKNINDRVKQSQSTIDFSKPYDWSGGGWSKTSGSDETKISQESEPLAVVSNSNPANVNYSPSQNVDNSVHSSSPTYNISVNNYTNTDNAKQAEI